MQITLDAGLLIAIIGAATGVLASIAKIISSKGKAKLDNEKLISELVEKALGINRQEIETIRTLNKDLTLDKEKADELLISKDSEIQELKKTLAIKETDYKHLQLLLEDCIQKCSMLGGK